MNCASCSTRCLSMSCSDALSYLLGRGEDLHPFRQHEIVLHLVKWRRHDFAGRRLSRRLFDEIDDQRLLYGIDRSTEVTGPNHTYRIILQTALTDGHEQRQKTSVAWYKPGAREVLIVEPLRGTPPPIRACPFSRSFPWSHSRVSDTLRRDACTPSTLAWRRSYPKTSPSVGWFQLPICFMQGRQES